MLSALLRITKQQHDCRLVPGRLDQIDSILQLLDLSRVLQVCHGEVNDYHVAQAEAVLDRILAELALAIHEHSVELVCEGFAEEDVDLTAREG